MKADLAPSGGPGCAGNSYCPTQSVKRDEMAKFLSNAFALELNEP
jgi:hypothetical protein